MVLPGGATFADWRDNPAIGHKVANDLADASLGILSVPGAIPGGVAFSTAAFVQALRIIDGKGGGALYIPPWLTFLVDLDVLALPSRCLLWGGGTLKTNQTTAGAFITATGITGSTIDGIRFQSPNDSVRAIQLASATDITVSRNTASQCSLIATNQGVTYASASSSNASQGISILGNTCKQTGTPTSANAAILVYYALGANVVGNSVDGYAFGIEWWGGDASPSIDGAVANERKCREIAITGNRVRNTQGAGIWGSMGQEIAVTGNNLRNCGDVGIDFEGCVSGTASGNSVRACANGCLATFSYCRNILFEGNTVQQDANDKDLVYIHNNMVDTNNKDISVVNNTMWCSAGIGRVFVETAENVTIKGNTLRNVKIYTYANNQKITTVVDNDILMTYAAAAAFAVVDVGGNNSNGKATVKNNRIHTTVTQPSGSRAIKVTQFDTNTYPVNVVSANEMSGFATPIEIAWTGTNAAVNSRTVVQDNNFGDSGATVVRTESGSAVSFVRLEGNHLFDGNPYPGAVPTTGRWEAGQRIFYSAPAAAGKIGAVCTTAGTPGTWKDFGVIDT